MPPLLLYLPFLCFAEAIIWPSGPQSVERSGIDGPGGALLTLFIKLPKITQAISTRKNVGISNEGFRRFKSGPPCRILIPTVEHTGIYRIPPRRNSVDS